MKVVCPICGKEGKFAYFDAPDFKGTIAMVTHRTGEYEEIIDAWGQKRTVERMEQHYLTQKDLEKTTWFSDWKKKRDADDEQHRKDMMEKMDKTYQEEYFRELQKEHEEEYEDW